MGEFIKKNKIKKLNEFVKFEDEHTKLRRIGLTEIEIPFGDGRCSWSCSSSQPAMNRQINMFQDFRNTFHVPDTPKWSPIVVDFKIPMEGENHDIKLHEWFRVGNWISKKNITITKWGEDDFGTVSKWNLIGCLPTQVTYNTERVREGDWDLSVTFIYDHANLVL